MYLLNQIIYKANVDKTFGDEEFPYFIKVPCKNLEISELFLVLYFKLELKTF